MASLIRIYCVGLFILSSLTVSATSTAVADLAFMFAASCARSTGGEVKCWGRLRNLGLERGGYFTHERDELLGDEPNEMGPFLPVVNLGTNRTVKELAYGYSSSHMCVLLDQGAVKCWGLSSYGELGGINAIVGDKPGQMGDFLPEVDLGDNRTAVQIALGNLHTCVILDTGDVKCFGYARLGGLGLGLGPDVFRVGIVPEEMGDNLNTVDLGSGRTALKIACGEFHTCVILDNHQVKCWGRGIHGALGYENNETLGLNISDMGDNLPFVDLGASRSAVQIGCGFQHTCALLDNGQIKCWGTGANGQLGNGRTDKVGSKKNEMGDNLPEVDLGANLTVVQLAIGPFHTCALLSNQQVKCFGSGPSGQLGKGNPESLGDDAYEMGDNLTAIDLGTNRSAVTIRAGFSRTCAILDDASLKCWGMNFYANLGLGDTVRRGDRPNTMGDFLLPVDLAFGQPPPSPSPTSSPTVFPTKSPTFTPTATMTPSRAPSSSPTRPPSTASPTTDYSFTITVAAASGTIIGFLFLVVLFQTQRRKAESDSSNVLANRNYQEEHRYDDSYDGNRAPQLALPVARQGYENEKYEKEDVPIARVISPSL